VTLNNITLPEPATEESLNITVSGTVKDYISPMAQVLINGTAIDITQTSAGQDGYGPFEGTFSQNITFSGNNTLIEAVVINSLGNSGKDSSLITVTRDANYTITGRTVTAQANLPQAPADEAVYLDLLALKGASAQQAALPELRSAGNTSDDLPSHRALNQLLGCGECRQAIPGYSDGHAGERCAPLGRHPVFSTDKPYALCDVLYAVKQKETTDWNVVFDAFRVSVMFNHQLLDGDLSLMAF